MARPAIAFGPVPSRRLGRSLGINNIPPKHCTYGCVYCQVGPTTHPTVDRRPYYDPELVDAEVAHRLRELDERHERVDMLTFVPDGEPTLDRHLGRAIDLVKRHGIPVAVITNGTLLDRAEVREELGRADWVCVKVDTVDERTWARLNRPHPSLQLGRLHRGARQFAAQFGGALVTDTMLVRGLNDAPAAVRATAAFVAELAPTRAFVGIPTRPTAEPTSAAPHPDVFDRAVAEFAAIVPVVEPLTGHGDQGYGLTGDVRADLTAIAAVHPMREHEIVELLTRSGADVSLLDELVEAGALTVVDYRGERFFVSRPHGPRSDERHGPEGQAKPSG